MRRIRPRPRAPAWRLVRVRREQRALHLVARRTLAPAATEVAGRFGPVELLGGANALDHGRRFAAVPGVRGFAPGDHREDERAAHDEEHCERYEEPRPWVGTC